MKCYQVRGEKGFTFVELVLVIVATVILGVLMNFGVSYINTNKLNSASRKLISDTRFAQQMSISRQLSTDQHGVVFNIPSANKYQVFKGNDPTIPERDPTGGRDYVVDYTTGDFKDVTISTTLTADGSNRRLVKFDSQGQPFGGNGSAVAAGSNTVTLTYQGSSTTVTIGPNTGRVY